MLYCHNMIDNRTGRERIRCWFICLVFLVLFSSPTRAYDTIGPTPHVYLSHVYLVLDSTAYSSIWNSDFLRDNFANRVTKTVNADSAQAWTAIYIWGENTYVELFVTDEAVSNGYSGIGFGVDVAGGIDNLYEYCTNLGMTNVHKGLKHRQVEDDEIPWFYILGFASEDSTATSLLHTWVMEYDYEYMKSKYPDENHDSLQITRKYYNQKEYRNDLLFKDIIEIELALNEFDHKNLSEVLKNYGYQIEQQGNLTIGNGPDITMILRAKSEHQSGICRIKFSLNDKQYEQQTVLFGTNSRLIFRPDGMAEWFFDIK